jgi:hypothetical protein
VFAPRFRPSDRKRANLSHPACQQARNYIAGCALENHRRAIHMSKSAREFKRLCARRKTKKALFIACLPGYDEVGAVHHVDCSKTLL